MEGHGTYPRERYEELEPLDRRGHVLLVRDRENGQLYVKKQIMTHAPEVYRQLFREPVEGMPVLLGVWPQGEELVTIEEYLPGRTLAEILAEDGPFNEYETLCIGIALCGILKALRAGRILWYAPDQDYGRKQAVFAPFFGVAASSVTATARLAQMGRAAVLPFTHYRLPGNAGYRVQVHAPLQGFPVGDEVADATTINALVERFIEPYPAQYMWLHRRFKTRPEGEERIYPRRRSRRRKARRRR